MTLKVIKWFPYKYQKDDFFNRIDDNSYLIVEKNNLQNILPQEMHGYLRDNKFGEHHLVVKKVDEESRSTFAFSNINRIDWEGGRYVINEDQWAVFWNSGQSTASDSGAFLQHGDYPDRTRPIEESEDFVRHVLDSEIDLHIPVSSIPIKPSGSLFELESTSHWNAADALQRWINER